MKVYIRLIIILSAIMLFGSFANFAQNEWGNNVIIVCQAGLSLVFLSEFAVIVISRIKVKQSTKFNYFYLFWSLFSLGAMVFLSAFTQESEIEPLLIIVLFSVQILSAFIDLYMLKKYGNTLTDHQKQSFESLMLCYVFLGFFFKNMFWAGSSLFILFGVFFLSVNYIIKIFNFFRKEWKKGITMITYLALGQIAAVIFGYAVVFKLLHWPYADFLFYFSSGITFLLFIGLIKWNYVYDGNSINVLKSMKLISAKVILIYFIAFGYSTYKYLVSTGIAPDFYTQKYPQEIEKLRDGTEKGAADSRELFSTYEVFTEDCKKNGQLK